MNDKKQNLDIENEKTTSGHQSALKGGQMPKAPGMPASGTKQAKPSAGVVLRRRPAFETKDPRYPQKWDVSQLRSSNVDNKENKQKPAMENEASTGNTMEGEHSSNVDNMKFEKLPKKRTIPQPVIGKLPQPKSVNPSGRTGPDKDVMERLRVAKKQQLLDRSKSKGRDPNFGAEEIVPGVTRSAETQQQYLTRGNQLLNRYRRERGIISEDLLSLDTMEFADWVLSLKPTIKPTTWRPYRQAAKAVLSTLPEAEAAIEILDADIAEPGSEPKRKSTATSDNRQKLPRRTSSQKAKSMAKADLIRIVNYLRHLSSSKYANTLADWLLAGVATGLRPAEWVATSIEVSEDADAPKGRYIWLYILNAKATNNRGNGAVRTIDISEVSDETFAVIKKMSDNGRGWLLREEHKEIQAQCAQLMANTCERMFPRKKLSYALSTTRHQFIANAKSYHKPESVSAMVGHSVTNTAVENYGKKSSAWEPEDIEDKAYPVPEEVDTVKRRYVFFEERKKLLEDAGIIKSKGSN